MDATPPRQPLRTAALVLPGPELVRERLASALAPFACGPLELAVDAGLAARVGGTLADRLDANALQHLANAAGAASAALRAAPLPPAICEVAREVAAAGNAGTRPSPHLALNRPDGRYRDGELVVLDVEVPPDIEGGYLYVAYVDPSGEVVHLFPSPRRPDPRVAPGQDLRLGAEGPAALDPAAELYRVGDPFGRGILVAILSPTLLPALVALQVQPLDRYRDALRRSLSVATRAGPVRVAMLPLETTRD